MKGQFPKTLLAALISAAGLTTGTAQADYRWAYQYNDQGLVTEIDGPRTDVADITRFEYNPKGQLTQVTNALGHTSQMSDFDLFGSPRTVVDANGITAQLSYDVLGRLTEHTLISTDGNATTTYQYNAVGLITKIIFADDSWLAYEYDAARRLVAVTNTLGESIRYTLDTMGNRTEEKILDGNSQITQQVQHQFDAMGRLLETVGAAGQRSQYRYDVDSNLTGTTDGNQRNNTQAFDALQRLVSITDAQNQLTHLSYDEQDNITTVTDPRGLVTRYEYDAFGRVIRQISPDTGTTTYTYDEAGNVRQRTDARGVVTEYRYDALNRVITQTYSGDASYDVTYQYDAQTTASGQPNIGIGRLTGMTDKLGSVSYRYDERGNLIASQRQLTAGNHQTDTTTAYTWDLAGRLTGITYPSGLTVSYQRNNAGQVEQIRFSGHNGEQILASDIIYQPFGGVQNLIWGNGINLARTYDQDGRLASQTVGELQSLNYQYDGVSNITGIARTEGNTTQSNQYQYDALDRLTHETGDAGSKQYTYDAVGNRTERTKQITQSDGTQADRTQTLLYSDTSNRLTQRGNRSLNYDVTGNILSGLKNKQYYNYDISGRLTSLTKNSILKTRYLYSGTGERLLKIHYKDDGQQTHKTYHYAPDGRLLQESFYNKQGFKKRTKHYLWLDNQPLAYIEQRLRNNGSIKQEHVAYLHTDHLNTPRLATDSNQTIVWRWDSDAFGLGKADKDPDGDGLKLNIALRFPGQYYDGESGLHYNYYRDYDPRIGRYIQSDPIGLSGGINTYGYVHQNPLKYTDPKGLAVPIVACALNPACVAAAAKVTAEACVVVGTAAYTGYQAVQAWGIFNESDDWMNDVEGPLSVLPPGYFDKPQSSTGGPDWDPDENDGNKTPGNNQAQNKEFHDATRGLTKAQKRRVHEEITGKGYSYKQIKEIADAVKSGRF